MAVNYLRCVLGIRVGSFGRAGIALMQSHFIQPGICCLLPGTDCLPLFTLFRHFYHRLAPTALDKLG